MKHVIGPPPKSAEKTVYWSLEENGREINLVASSEDFKQTVLLIREDGSIARIGTFQNVLPTDELGRIKIK